MITQFSFAQKIEPGRYFSVYKYIPEEHKIILNGEFGVIITFLDSNYFFYKYQDDITDLRGFGKYTLRKKFINFEFLDTSDKFDTVKYKILDSSITFTDSIEYYISVTDNYSVLQDAYIEFTNDSGKHINFGSDESGMLKCKIPKLFNPTKIRVVYLGYEIIEFSLLKNQNLKVEFIMSNKFKRIEAGETITYSIKEINLNGFYMIGGIFSEWTFFKRED